MQKSYFRAGAVSMAIAIILGAMAAHYLKTKLSADKISVFETGVKYQVYHSLGILLIASFYSRLKPNVIWSLRLMLIGILLFSGSVYLISISEWLNLQSLAKIAGPITPFGGMSFIIAWIILAFSLKTTSDE